MWIRVAAGSRRSSLKSMTLINVKAPAIPRPKVVVKGPIRCHKCQLLCQDAEHYLNHGCVEPKRPM